MTRDNLISIVNKICFGPAENEIITPLLDQLSDVLPHSNVSDLIFYNKQKLTPEQIVDRAMQQELSQTRKFDAKHDR